ncbi:hypothetical protein J4450_08325 [Candidatus Micrarchaeota archaeon]|nr:hypothetical protein [Candidatus Micrarchaeota archaeon]
MTGTAFRKLGGSEDKGVGQRLRDRVIRAVKPFVAAAALSLCSFEPVYEPPRRKTKILFKPGEREALEAEAREDERNGRFYEAGVKYAEVENAHKAREMAKALGEDSVPARLIHERIEEYC